MQKQEAGGGGSLKLLVKRAVQHVDNLLSHLPDNAGTYTYKVFYAVYR
jgi:hypothetical protein